MDNERKFIEIEVDEVRLVEAAIAGDAEAFGRLYDMHVNRVFRHAYYRVGNKTDAEDLTQRVFLKAWQAIGRYKKTASPFIAWLMTISHNLVIDFYRTRKAESYLDLDFIAHDRDPVPERAAELLRNAGRFTLEYATIQLQASQEMAKCV